MANFGACLAPIGANGAGGQKLALRFMAALSDGSQTITLEVVTAGFDPTIAGSYRTAITDALVAAFAANFNSAVLPRASTAVPTYQAGQ